MSAERVLIVDDDLDVLGANARFLRVSGHEVVVADSASRRAPFARSSACALSASWRSSQLDDIARWIEFGWQQPSPHGLEHTKQPYRGPSLLPALPHAREHAPAREQAYSTDRCLLAFTSQPRSVVHGRVCSMQGSCSARLNAHEAL